MTNPNLKLLLTMISAGLLNGCVQYSTQQTRSVSIQSAPVAANYSAACPAGPLDSRFDQPVRRSGFDNALFDAAILHFTNQRRCANGLNALAADPGLHRVAAIHSDDMASRRFFSHTSPVPGRETLVDRLESGGVKIRGAAENIATRPRLQIAGNQPFFVDDAQRCQFTSQGRTVQPHTYKTLASSFVTQWENSPGHRRNLMDPRYTRLGSGGTPQSNPQVCGDIVATQNFAS